ncbi:MAG: dienelactone hydrolase family protein [Alphaproteobacteria bacterium]
MPRFFKILFLCAIFTPALIAPALANSDRTIEYDQNEEIFEGYWVQAECENAQEAPLILIVHQWKGITEHEKDVAEKLSGQCYNAFVIDMYGKDIRPDTNEEAAAQSSKYKNNPELARSRLNNAMAVAKKLSGSEKTAIIGYCFGGTMALEMARSGENIAGAVSFHGGLSSQAPVSNDSAIKASILVHHGDADPLVKPEEVNSFLEEMRSANADWVFIRYADAVHAFTQEEAGDDPSTGVAYNEKADKRSWDITQEFFKDIF